MNRSAFVVLLVVALAVCASCNPRKRQCPRANEHWTDCGTECEKTCELPYPRACIMSCKLDTCQCDEGFYRASNGNCVTLEECGKC